MIEIQGLLEFVWDQENQVAALKEKGIAAEYLSSTQTSIVKNKVKCADFDIFLLSLCQYC